MPRKGRRGRKNGSGGGAGADEGGGSGDGGNPVPDADEGGGHDGENLDVGGVLADAGPGQSGVPLAATGPVRAGIQGGGGGGGGRPAKGGGGGGGGGGRPAKGGGGGGGGGGRPAKGGGGGGGGCQGSSSGVKKKTRQSKEEYSKWSDGPDAELYKQAKLSLIAQQQPTKDLGSARLAAEAAARQQEEDALLPPQKNLKKDLPKFPLTTKITHASLIQHYQKRSVHCTADYGFHMEVVRDDDSTFYLPVTPEKEPLIEDRKHYVIEFTRESDNALIRVLVEAYSGYVVAFQVLNREDDVDPFDAEQDPPPEGYPPGDEDDQSKVRWFVFSSHEELPIRFGRRRTISYGNGYNYLSKVNITPDIGDKLFSFLESFRTNPTQGKTDEGKLLFDTLFVIVAEAFRFPVVYDWITTRSGLIPQEFPSMIHCWLKLSKGLFFVALYLLESSLAARFHDQDMSKIAKKTEKIAKSHLAMVQLKTQGCGLGIFPKVEKIRGSIVTLQGGLKMDDVILDRAMMLRIANALHLVRHDPRLIYLLRCRQYGFRGRLDD